MNFSVPVVSFESKFFSINKICTYSKYSFHTLKMGTDNKICGRQKNGMTSFSYDGLYLALCSYSTVWLKQHKSELSVKAEEANLLF